MAAPRRQYAGKTFLPHKPKDENLPNWLALERQFHDNRPVAIGGTGDPGTILAGTPSAFSIVTWTPNANPLYDQYKYFQNLATTDNIRIPWDGFYSFWMLWSITDGIGNTFTQLQVDFQSAPTSDSGLGAPVFATNYTETHTYGTNAAGTNLDNAHFYDYRGIELHANDLVRFRVRQNGSVNLADALVTQSEFRFMYPIPSELP